MQINLVRLRSVCMSMSVLKVVNFSSSLEKGSASKPWVPETLADAGVSLHLDLQKITTPVSKGVGRGVGHFEAAGVCLFTKSCITRDGDVAGLTCIAPAS
jgi:hypothetical protein